MLTIVGGTYVEICQDPIYFGLYGSGLRAAIALSNIEKKIQFVSCVGEKDIEQVIHVCKQHQILPSLTPINQTISFNYLHPLKSPRISPDLSNHLDIILPEVDSKNILYYGMAEASPQVTGSYVVYDPQSGISFQATNSSAEHLALVLNRKEALHLSEAGETTDIVSTGKILIEKEQAEVVIIKNGSQGAVVFDSQGTHSIRVYETKRVWPIGSGDIFSAAFAWQWILERKAPADAADYASRYTARYCETKQLPFLKRPKPFKALNIQINAKKIYLAGPFFTIAERWLIDELYNILTDFGNNVFSPLHDVGLGSSTDIVDKDLEGLRNADCVLAVVNGSDPGTLFEIGYARALGKPVVVISENVNSDNLLMLVGSNCVITDDLSTAIYKASW